MKILLTGATGFLGRALILRLQRDGHQLTAWARSPDRARSQLGAAVTVLDAAGGAPALQAAVADADAVINLAGEPIAGGRWTAARRQRIWSSRVEATTALVQAIAATSPPQRPNLLISASAVGFYGDRADELLDESSDPGVGFLADVSRAWENAARQGEALGLRVLLPRLGVVLGLGGGFLGKLLPLFRLGLGARLGDGRQFVPWIHLDDVVEAMVAALGDHRWRGPVNLVAPQRVRMVDLTRALAAAAGSGLRLAAPRWALRLALGEAAATVLGSQNVTPARLTSLGFQHRFPDLSSALADLTGAQDAVGIERLNKDTPATVVHGRYLDRRRPTHLLRSQVTLEAPLDQVFHFFSLPQNLALITPSSMSFRIRQAPAQMHEGDTIDYSLRIAGAPLKWRTSIEYLRPGHCFVDAQTAGPYHSWWHEHHFTADGPRTVMEDRVYYAPPLGVLGRIAQRLFVAPQLRQVFGYRTQAIRQRFRAIYSATA